GVESGIDRTAEPAKHTQRYGNQGRQEKSGKHCPQTGNDLIDISRFAGIGAYPDFSTGILYQNFRIALLLTFVKRSCFFTFLIMFIHQVPGLSPHNSRARDGAKTGLYSGGRPVPDNQKNNECNNGYTHYFPE